MVFDKLLLPLLGQDNIASCSISELTPAVGEAQRGTPCEPDPQRYPDNLGLCYTASVQIYYVSSFDKKGDVGSLSKEMIDEMSFAW